MQGAVVAGSVIAAALALFTLTTPFVWFSSIVAFTILLVLLAFDDDAYRSVMQSIAYAAACGLALAIASAAVFRMFAKPVDLDARLGRDWMPLIWAIATVVITFIDRARMSARRTGVSEIYERETIVPRVAVSPIPPQPRPEPQPVIERPAAARAAAAPPPAPAFVYRAPEPPVERHPPTPEPPPPSPPRPMAEPASPPSAPAPVRTGKEATIYVNLVGEGIACLRAVRAEHLGRDFYKIAENAPEGETWEYQAGQVVRCEKKKLSSGKALVAIEEAPRQQ